MKANLKITKGQKLLVLIPFTFRENGVIHEKGEIFTISKLNSTLCEIVTEEGKEYFVTQPTIKDYLKSKNLKKL